MKNNLCIAKNNNPNDNTPIKQDKTQSTNQNFD